MTAQIHKLTMPKWGLSMQEGTVVEWLMAEGASVSIGDEIAEIETEKVNNVYETPFQGVLRRRVAEVGDAVPVGGLIGVIAAAEATDAEIDLIVEEFASNFVPEEADEIASGPKSVTVSNRVISYLSIGDELVDATPLILVHGFTGDVASWMFNQANLATSRQVIALDLPGHGGSDKFVDDGGIDYLTSAVSGFIEEIGLDKVHLAGHSLGGAVAARVAGSRPELVATLTLIASAGVGSNINGEIISALAMADRRRDTRQTLQRLVSDPDLISRDMVEQFLRLKRTDGALAAIARIASAFVEGDRQRIDVVNNLADYAKPVLAIWGANDAVIPTRPAGTLPENVECHVIDDVGHLPHMEAATKVNELITGFLSAQSV